MSYQPRDNTVLGIEYDSPTLRAALVQEEKGKIRVQKLMESSFLALTGEEGNVKPLYINPQLNEIKEIAHKYLVITALNSSDVLVRRLRIKLTKEKDIDDVFAFQAEPQLPYSLDQAILDKFIVEKQDATTLLTFFAAKKDSILKHLTFWQSLDIDPEIVSSEAVASGIFASLCSNERGTQFVVNIRETSTVCVIQRKGKVLAAHSIPQGIKNEQEENNPNFDELLRIIGWNYLALIKETKIKDPITLAVIGEGANNPQLAEKLAETLELPLDVLVSLDSNYTMNEIQPYAGSIGLALLGLPLSQDGINFRRQTLSYKTPWKRYKKSLLTYGILALLLACALYIFGLSYYTYREDILKQRFLSLLSIVQKPYQNFEKEYETKFRMGSEKTLSLNDLNTQDISARLDFLEKEIRSMPDNFPLLPNTPRVSDVLAWLSNHPSLQCNEELKEQGECPPFIIDNFYYSVVKRPEFNKKTEKYQVKIDLEFSTSSPRVAREFHDALIAPNDFIDPKGEIKWGATKGKYRTSFYLKDKTVYSTPLKEPL